MVGGSISTCCGTSGGFYRVLFDWIVRSFPLAEGGPQHAMHNGATGGVQSQYMTSCLKWHMPQTVDLVIVRPPLLLLLWPLAFELRISVVHRRRLQVIGLTSTW